MSAQRAEEDISSTAKLLYDLTAQVLTRSAQRTTVMFSCALASREWWDLTEKSSLVYTTVKTMTTSPWLSEYAIPWELIVLPVCVADGKLWACLGNEDVDREHPEPAVGSGSCGCRDSEEGGGHRQR